MTERIEISRRKLLAGIGTAGLASAGAGVGTTALFNDRESFERNTLAAGELDLKVDWEEHYSYPQVYGKADPRAGLDVTRSEPSDPSAYVGLPDPDDPVVWVHEDDLGAYMSNTAIEAFPDPDDDGEQEVHTDSFTFDPCTDGADLPEDLDPAGLRTDNADTNGPNGGGRKPLVSLDDVKPGDFGEFTFSFHLCDNPGYVWLQAANFTEDGGDTTEPEPTPDDGELAEAIRTVWWYDSRGDNVFQSDCPEQLYLTDSKTDPTTLYEVDLIEDGNGTRAELTEIWPNGASAPDFNYFDQTDAIAATPSGDEIILYDKGSGHLGRYDVDADSFTDLGSVSGDPGGVVLAGYSPSGTLWGASQADDHLYTVDHTSTPPSATDRGDTGIDLQGADLTFASDGTLYVWTADSSDQGLYRVDDPSSDATAVPVDSDNIGNLDARITGLAIRGSGTGHLVASDRKHNDVVKIDRTTGEIAERYRMTLDTTGDDVEYEYDFGDMSAGALCGDSIHRGTLKADLEALDPENGGAPVPLDGNRATTFDEFGGGDASAARECFPAGVTHYVGFGWWLPEDVGNEIQGDSVSFDLGFYTEQCRDNDGALGP